MIRFRIDWRSVVSQFNSAVFSAPVRRWFVLISTAKMKLAFVMDRDFHRRNPTKRRGARPSRGNRLESTRVPRTRGGSPRSSGPFPDALRRAETPPKRHRGRITRAWTQLSRTVGVEPAVALLELFP